MAGGLKKGAKRRELQGKRNKMLTRSEKKNKSLRGKHLKHGEVVLDDALDDVADIDVERRRGLAEGGQGRLAGRRRSLHEGVVDWDSVLLLALVHEEAHDVWKV